jgi:hypothetical protein
VREWTYTRFLRKHPRFLLIAGGKRAQDWLLSDLAANGARIAPLGEVQYGKIFDVIAPLAERKAETHGQSQKYGK